MIIAFDIDMTLLDHKDYEIPNSAMLAIRKLKQAGHKIVLASGRNLHNYYSRDIVDSILPHALVELNGARVVVGKEVISDIIMDKALVKRILTYSEEHGEAVGMTDGDDDYYTNQDYIYEREMLNWGECGRRFKDYHLLEKMDVHTLVYYGDPARAKQLGEHFPMLSVLLFSGKGGADIVPNGITKAEGLKELCHYYGMSMKDVVAFGDGSNDVEMLKEAGMGVAMGNAVEELKVVADMVTDPIGEDGVWKACKKLNLF